MYKKLVLYFIFCIKAVVALSQTTSAFVETGVCYSLLLNKEDNDFKRGTVGYQFSLGTNRYVKKHILGVEGFWNKSNTQIIAGPFFFPVDIPPSPGNTYKYQIDINSLNILIKYGYSIKKDWSIFVGGGVNIPFYEISREVLEGSSAAFTNNETVFYAHKKNYIFMSGIGYRIRLNQSMNLTIDSQFSTNILPLKYNLSFNKTDFYNPLFSVSMGLEFFAK